MLFWESTFAEIVLITQGYDHRQVQHSVIIMDCPAGQLSAFSICIYIPANITANFLKCLIECYPVSVFFGIYDHTIHVKEKGLW